MVRTYRATAVEEGVAIAPGQETEGLEEQGRIRREALIEVVAEMPL